MYKQDLCGNRTVLYLDCGGGYWNLHMIKSHGAVHTGCTIVSLLILILCYHYVACRLGGKLREAYTEHLYTAFQLFLSINIPK